MQVVATPIERVIPYARNPRKNSGAVAKVAASLKEFGWQQPIVVDSEGVVIAGHTRLEAARTLGFTHVPVHIAAELSPLQVKAYRLADNRVGQEAEWDDDLLAIEIGELAASGGEIDIDLSGFDPVEIDRVLRLDDQFTPTLNPTTGTLGVTEAQVAAVKGKLETNFADKAKQTILQVSCPHCGEDFGVNKAAL